MRSIPLDIAARLLAPVFVALSLLVLYRGHHLPGGGFIGGLLAASGVALILLANGVDAARRYLRVKPWSLVVAGLSVALASTLAGPILLGASWMTGAWLPSFHLPLLGTVHLGTPLLFDLGVYFTVTGFVLQCLFSLSEGEKEDVRKGGGS